MERAEPQEASPFVFDGGEMRVDKIYKIYKFYEIYKNYKNYENKGWDWFGKIM